MNELLDPNHAKMLYWLLGPYAPELYRIGKSSLELFKETLNLWISQQQAKRAQNLEAILDATARIRQKQGVSDDAHPHPRLAAAIIEKGTWSDDEYMQEKWAGLLCASSTENRRRSTQSEIRVPLRSIEPRPSQNLGLRM
jgi:hypothetical protein